MDKNIDINNLLNGLTPFDIRTNLFKKGNYDFIVDGEDRFGKPATHKKMKKCFEILMSNNYKSILYGGGAGSGKSWTGCCWLLFMCILYPKSKWFVARNEIGLVIKSVYVTFIKVCEEYGFDDFNFNAVHNFIKFGNGSMISFVEIKKKPSDPNYTSLGSTEYTGGWIEEGGEIDETGATVIGTRVGRHLNNKFTLNGNVLRGIVFITCNPEKNWLKTEFYDKWKKNELEPKKFYLPALIDDNPFATEDYHENLNNLKLKNQYLYEKLKKGDWDYSDNPYQLPEQEMIEAIFSNDHVDDGKTYLTADVARQGSDKAVIIAWSGWVAKEIITYDKSSIPDIVHAIKYLRHKYRIPKTRCIADGDGVGGGVIDYTDIKEFRNNARPIRKGKDTPNYRNLQIQCLYLLAEKINAGEIWINADIESKVKEDIKVELAQIQSAPSKRNDNKLDCKAKGDIKSDIGRSPDYRDALFMRIFFDLKKTVNIVTNWN